MACVNCYCTLAELRYRLDETVVDAAKDAVLERIIEAASRAIDAQCGRHFFTVTETRYFSPEWSSLLPVDDLVSVTSLATDDAGNRTYTTSWISTDYDLTPENAALRSEPYTAIRVAPNGTQSFPRLARGVRITGSWGWPAVPDVVTEACLLLAHRYVQRQNSPLGIVHVIPEAPATSVRATDPDVANWLSPYRRLSAMAV